MFSLAAIFLCLLVYVEGQTCGYRPHTRIVGGTAALPGDWPWQAQIQLSYGLGEIHFCGATLIHPQWVLTAAHCVEGMNATDFKIRLGAHARKAPDAVVPSEQILDVEKIYAHSKFNDPVEYAFDFALMKLSRPAMLNKYVGLACLPEFKTTLPVGTNCYVTGWGSLTEQGGSPDVLMQAKVPIIEYEKCEASYPGWMHETMVCAGYAEGGIDACQGDSGGPLVCKDESNGRWYIEGVVSWGLGCAAKEQYGVYSSVRYLRNFIDAVIAQGSK